MRSNGKSRMICKFHLSMISASLFLCTLCAASEPAEEHVYKNTADRPLKIYLTYPENWSQSDSRAVLVFFHNGGWKPEIVNRQFREQTKYFAARGMVVARADYREKDKSGVTSEKCMEDILSAVRWLCANAETLGIDPSRIAAGGGSGSGHLPASVFYMDDIRASGDDSSICPQLRALMLFNPDLDVLDPRIMQRMLGGDPEHAKQMPPTLAFYGTRDISHTLILDFVNQAQNLGMPVEAFVGEGAVHGFFKFSPWLEKTTLRADAFLQSAGLLEFQPRVKPPSKTKPDGYDAKVEANMVRWREQHESLVKARKEQGGAPSIASAAPAQGSKTAGAPRLVDLLRRFPEADADKNGVLTMQEARAYRSKMKQRKKAMGGRPPATKGGANTHSLFVPSRDWDVNKDGRISREEFKAPAILFNNLDYDGSAFLNGDELIKLDSKLNMSKTGESIWSVPPETQHHGIEHKSYFSQAMQTDVGYNIYLPDEYKASQKRYPVIYHLHGSGGNESAQIDLSKVYHKAITENRMSPVIIVFVNGGKRSYYCDSADGKIMSETTIIHELIPHIDTTCRTIPEKPCRVIHGFSMGGFGAMRLAAKYPDLFCAVLSFGGGMAAPGSVHELFLKHILGNDARLFNENNPADIVVRNKSKLVGMTFWLFSGTRDVALEDSTWAHEFLQSHHVPDRFEVSQDVGHALKKHYTLFGNDIFQMLQKHFAASESWTPGSAEHAQSHLDGNSPSFRIEQLKSDDTTLRKDAAIAILAAGDSAIQAWPELVSALTDDQRLDCAVAGRVLFSGTPKKQDVPALIRALRSDTKSRTAAAWELSRLGSAAEAAPALIEALESEDKHARNFAVIALGMVGPPPETVSFLVKVMKDAGSLKPPQLNYRYPRASAALVLGLMGSQAKEAVFALADQLKSESGSWEYHRAAAAFALGEIGPDAKDVVPAVTRALEDPSPIVRLWAAKALERIVPESSDTRSEESVAELLRILSLDAGGPTHNSVRKGLRALATSDAAWKDVSKGAGKKRLPVHESIAIAVGYLDSLPKMPTALEIRMNRPEKDEDVRNYFMALGGIQQGIVPAMLEALGDEGRAKRRSAAKALGRIGESDEEAVSALEKALFDEDWMVRTGL